MLLDLAAGGFLHEEGGHVVPGSGRPAAPVLQDALAVLRESEKPRDAGHWVRKLPGKLEPIKERAAAGLVERGVLSPERRKVLGIIPRERYVEADDGAERALRERLRSELLDEREPSERTVLLISLLKPLGLVEKLVPKAERKLAKQRAEELADDGAVGSAVSRSVSEVQAAVLAGVVVATTTGAITAGADGG